MRVMMVKPAAFKQTRYSLDGLVSSGLDAPHVKDKLPRSLGGQADDCGLGAGSFAAAAPYHKDETIRIWGRLTKLEALHPLPKFPVVRRKGDGRGEYRGQALIKPRLPLFRRFSHR